MLDLLGLSFSIISPPDSAEPLPKTGEGACCYAKRAALLKTLASIPLVLDNNQNYIKNKSLEYIDIKNFEDCSSEFKDSNVQDLKKSKLGFNSHSIVIGADTIIYSNNNILGKPKDKEDAFNMLFGLQGSSHLVITGCCVLLLDYIFSFSVRTKVFMLPVSEFVLRSYIGTGEPFDKSGGYAIQGQGSFLISKIEGSYTNVVGLPVSDIFSLLFNFGYLL